MNFNNCFIFFYFFFLTSLPVEVVSFKLVCKTIFEHFYKRVVPTRMTSSSILIDINYTQQINYLYWKITQMFQGPRMKHIVSVADKEKCLVCTKGFEIKLLYPSTYLMCCIKGCPTK